MESGLPSHEQVVRWVAEHGKEYIRLMEEQGYSQSPLEAWQHMAVVCIAEIDSIKGA